MNGNGGLRSYLSDKLSKHCGLNSDLSGRLRFDLSVGFSEHGLLWRCGLSNSELNADKSSVLLKQPASAVRTGLQRTHVIWSAPQALALLIEEMRPTDALQAEPQLTLRMRAANTAPRAATQ